MPTNTPGGILSQAQTQLTLPQRAMYDRLLAVGVAPAIAKQLAIAVAKGATPSSALKASAVIAKRDNGASAAAEALVAVRLQKASYHQAFVQAARDLLPGDLVDKIHVRARAKAGGHASGEARRQAATDTNNDGQEMDGACEAMKSEGAVPPKAVQSACARGLELVADGKGGDGLTSGAKARARSMADGGAVSSANITKMRAWFARHDSYAKESSPPSPGYVAWLLWGGDAGKTWSESQAAKLDKADKLPLGAAFSHARSSGKKKDKDSVKRRANEWLRREGDETMGGVSKARAALEAVVAHKSAPLEQEIRADEFAGGPKKKKQPKKMGEVAKSVETRILKAEQTPWKRLVTSVVYEPNTYDSDMDFMDEETIEKACHNFMRNGGYINVEHAGDPVDAQVVENWIAPADITFGAASEAHLSVKKGTWLQTVAVNDEGLWQGVLDGTFGGFSLEGTALREEGYLP